MFSNFTSKFSTHKIVRILVIWGVLLRIIPWLHNRSLWYDEANLATGIIRSSFGELAGGLPFDQTAPLFFLYLEKIAITVFGSGEMALRFFPLVAGLLSLYIFSKLVIKILPDYFAILALAFFVFHPRLVYFSSEVKQYSFDVLTTIVLLYQVIKIIKNKSSEKKLLELSILGSIFIWLSQPIVFVLAGVWLALAVYLYQMKRSILKLWLPTVCWTSSFLLFFYFQLLPSINNPSLSNYHTEYFMPLEFWHIDNWQWYWNTSINTLRNPGGFFFNYLALPFAIFGFYFSKKELGFPIWTAIIIPGILAFLVSGLGLYSTIPRLLLFISPMIILMVVFGLYFLYQKIAHFRFSSIIITIISGILMLQSFLNTSIHNIAKFKREEIKTALNYIEANRQSTDLLYAYPFTDAALRYYTPRYQNLDPIIHGKPLWEDWKTDFDKVPKDTRIWLLFVHYSKEDRQQILNYLKGEQLDFGEDKQTAWYLFKSK